MNLSIKNNYITKILERKKLLLWSIILLGLLLRIAFIIIWDRRLNYDTQNYIAQAEGILNGNPVSGFPNGYPLIIAAVIFFTGKNLIFPAMISLNLLAQFFTGYFLYKISKTLFSESHIQSINQSINQSPNQSINESINQSINHPITQSPNRSITQSSNNSITQSSNNSITQSSNHSISLLILLLFAIYPTQILYTNSVLTETITTLFVTAFVYGILNNSYFFGGLSLAIASMLRTSFLPALIITSLYILYITFRSHQRKSAKISENPRAERQSINQSSTNHSITQSLNHSITQSPYTKYLSGLALVLSFFALLDFTGTTKFPTNQNYNLLIAINGRSSSINHNISNFSESEFLSPHLTYLNFAHHNTKEFIIQRADAFWGLWGVLPFETNHLYSKLLLSIRTILFLSWIYWLYKFIRKKEISEITKFQQFLVLLTVLVTTITIIHTVYFSSFRFIVPIEPLLIIVFISAFYKFKSRAFQNIDIN